MSAENYKKKKFIASRIELMQEWLGDFELLRYLDQLEANINLQKSIESAVENVEFFKTKKWDGVLWIAGLYRVSLYLLVRSLNANKVVETGVLHGLSSVFLLQALKDNTATGKMISIDFPSTYEGGPSNRDGYQDTLPPSMPSGWIVGEEYQKFWELKLGDSRDLLEDAIGAEGSVDMFIHDSDHTYEVMWFEFNVAWRGLRSGGVLLADNIESNTAFFDFCLKVGRIPLILPADPEHLEAGDAGIRVGIIKK